eukprot:scaffold13455_cov169-Isochrysis_galbana.AAC.1
MGGTVNRSLYSTPTLGGGRRDARRAYQVPCGPLAFLAAGASSCEPPSRLAKRTVMSSQLMPTIGAPRSSETLART